VQDTRSVILIKQCSCRAKCFTQLVELLVFCHFCHCTYLDLKKQFVHKYSLLHHHHLYIVCTAIIFLSMVISIFFS
jgi:hypothetical protein